MEITNLMIGDLIKTNPTCGKLAKNIESTIGKVSEICFSSLDGYYITIAGHKEKYYEDEVEPIPLTKEILLKNGFEDFAGGGCIIKEPNEDEEPIYIWNGNGSIYVVDYCSLNKYTYIKECKYVHEFQHELKSCGIEKDIIL